MNAVLVEEFGALDNARVRTVADPVPGKGEVRIVVKAAEVNFPDILVIEGRYQIKPPLPFSPGKAAAGIVGSVGEGVRNVKSGDRVVVQVEYGAYAEQVIAPAVSCYPIPDAISFEAAAALSLTYQTSYFALMERCQMWPGETVLVLGASGGIGLAAVQLARALGAGKVIAGTRGSDGVAIIRKGGADAVIDLAMDNLRDGLRDRVHELTGGRGADVVIDPVGGDANAAALRAMAWRGRMVIVGFAAGTVPFIKASYLLVKNISVSGLQWSDYRDKASDWAAKTQADIFKLYTQEKINPHISRILPLAEFRQALDALRDAKVEGKIILSTNG